MRAVLMGSLTCLLLVAAPAEARRGDRLQTHKGVLMLGGRLAFDVGHFNPDQGDSQSGVVLDFSPVFGGFAVRNLLLYGGLEVSKGWGDLYENDPTDFGFRFGLQYLFNYRSIVVPYIGFTLGPTFQFFEGGNSGTAFGMSFPAGILISLNAHVAVNIGTEVTLTIGVDDPEATIVQVPIGYLGVSAFF